MVVMPLTPDQNAQIDALISDFRAKEAAFDEATIENDAAQSAAQAAVATASGTLQAKVTAHDEANASVDAMVAFLESLKNP